MDKLVLKEDTAHILTIGMNLNQQMDIGGNKNVTNDTRIIRKFAEIRVIALY